MISPFGHILNDGVVILLLKPPVLVLLVLLVYSFLNEQKVELTMDRE